MGEVHEPFPVPSSPPSLANGFDQPTYPQVCLTVLLSYSLSPFDSTSSLLAFFGAAECYHRIFTTHQPTSTAPKIPFPGMNHASPKSERTMKRTFFSRNHKAFASEPQPPAPPHLPFHRPPALAVGKGNNTGAQREGAEHGKPGLSCAHKQIYILLL